MIESTNDTFELRRLTPNVEIKRESRVNQHQKFRSSNYKSNPSPSIPPKLSRCLPKPKEKKNKRSSFRVTTFSSIMCPTGSALSQQKTKNSDLRLAFNVLDVDHDGKISHDDLRTIYGGHLAGETSKDDAIRSMISAADFNKDGFVEYEEFEKVLDSRRKVRNHLMEDVFKVMDKDGDGKVGHEDLKSYLGLAGFEINDDDVKAMLKLAGGDQENGVTFDRLLKILPL